jgi:hypothetical protein
MASDPSDPFTARIWALDNRRFYKGRPIEAPDAGAEPLADAE